MKANLMFKFLRFCLVIFLISGTLIFAALFYYYHTLPEIEKLTKLPKKQITRINYSNNNLITAFGDLYANQIMYSQIPQHLIDAVIATEDRRFFKHSGFDPIGIIRAAYVNYKTDRISQGASTISQQLVKILFLNPERTFKRKLQEVLLSIKLERIFSKEQIITLYLNHAYFGSGNYGIADSAKFYFNKRVEELNLAESAMLTGLLKAPSRLSPLNNKRLSKKRMKQVLINMHDAGYLSEYDFNNVETIKDYRSSDDTKLYFADYVNQEFSYYLNEEQNKPNSHLTITSTLDEYAQNLINKKIQRFIIKNSKTLKESQLAVIVMGKKGDILAMSGGRNYRKSPFNRAIKSKRQAGSAFKTFIYLTAFQNGLNPDDQIEDKKITIGKWSPNNYDDRYYSFVSLREAFAKSLNSAAIQLTWKLDKEEIIDNARKMGINSNIDKNDLTIALGTMEVSLLDMITSYAAIANDGHPVIPYAIEEIENSSGELLYKRHSSGMNRIIEPEHVDMIKEILRETVANGSGRNANVKNNIHGKTGTTQNYRDAWFIGFDDNYVIGIWIGNDNNSPTNHITGGSLPALLFADIIKGL